MKKFITLDWHLVPANERSYNSFTNRATYLNAFLYVFTFAHILVALVLSLVNTDLYYAYTEEDGYIEYTTAIFLLATALLCFYKASITNMKLPKMFLYPAAVIFFLGFGEEISWGQRIFGFATPDDLMKINSQDEFNVHNIKLDGVSINQFIFGKVQYTCVFIYFLAFPILYRRISWFKNVVQKFEIPISSTTQSFMYFLAFLSIQLVRQGDRWELQEFVLTSFLFFVFLVPANSNTRDKSSIAHTKAETAIVS